VAADIPHRERYLRLNHALARRIVDAHEGWLSDVERELARRPRASDRSSRRR
jgi:hypothetical protein